MILKRLPRYFRRKERRCTGKGETFSEQQPAESFESPRAGETQEDTRFVIFLVNLTTRERERGPRRVEKKASCWKINEERAAGGQRGRGSGGKAKNELRSYFASHRVSLSRKIGT